MKDLLTAREAAALLGISRTLVYYYIKKGIVLR